MSELIIVQNEIGDVSKSQITLNGIELAGVKRIWLDMQEGGLSTATIEIALDKISFNAKGNFVLVKDSEGNWAEFVPDSIKQ